MMKHHLLTGAFAFMVLSCGWPLKAKADIWSKAGNVVKKVTPPGVCPPHCTVPGPVKPPPPVQKTLNNLQKAADKGQKDVATTLNKAGKDTGAETKRAVIHVADAARAVAKFTQSETKGNSSTASNIRRRFREGKIVDAIWHSATEPLQHTSADAALAVQQSSILNAMGQITASAYGGVGGAAAYAAWYTYSTTKNPSLALRIAIITGASAAALGQTAKLGTAATPATRLAEKAIVAGAIGGMAVAAAGGDKTAVKDGFLKAGGMVLVQDGYEAVTHHPLDPRIEEGGAYCMRTVGEDCSPPLSAYKLGPDGEILYDKNGEPEVDVTKTDPLRQHVGKWSNAAGQPNYVGESSGFMTTLSHVPGMNAMALLHDTWAVSWNMNGLATATTILPATVFTYIGTASPYQRVIQKAAGHSSRKPKP
jgi:hypothetical protein